MDEAKEQEQGEEDGSDDEVEDGDDKEFLTPCGPDSSTEDAPRNTAVPLENGTAPTTSN